MKSTAPRAPRVAAHKTRARGLARINIASNADASAALSDCCGSREWVRRMLARRPFESPEELYNVAGQVWNGLRNEHWLEAFRHHPQIGSNNAEQKQSRTAKAWSASEQSAAGGASTDAKEQLAAANRVYERKFGFIFIVCAAGKATEEILALLNQRLRNSSSVEIRVAAEEQRKITRVRLEKLLTK